MQVTMVSFVKVTTDRTELTDELATGVSGQSRQHLANSLDRSSHPSVHVLFKRIRESR